MNPTILKIIALEGKSNTGKSSDIKSAVIELIEKEGYRVIWMNLSYDGKTPVEAIIEHWYTKEKHNVSDLCILLEKDGKILCVLSVGDDVTQIQNAYCRTVRHLTVNADILLVCACHPNSPARRMLDAWAMPNAVHVIEKKNIFQTAVCNLLKAI